MNLSKSQYLFIKLSVFQYFILYFLTVLELIIKEQPFYNYFLNLYITKSYFEFIASIFVSFIIYFFTVVIPIILNSLIIIKYKNYFIFFVLSFGVNFLYVLLFEYNMNRLITLPILINFCVFVIFVYFYKSKKKI
jgi:hypothetical protein